MKALFSRIALVAAIMAICPAISAFDLETGGIVIDVVNNGEWSSETTDRFDVIPDSVASIDILGATCADAYLVSQGEDAKLYVGIRFEGAPLGDPVETSYQIFVDRFPEKDTVGTDGEQTDPWVGFYPDYRFKVTSKAGAIETTSYAYWDGNTWVDGDPSAITAAIGVNAYPSGPGTYGLLEVGLSWESIGNPDPKTPTSTIEWVTIDGRLVPVETGDPKTLTRLEWAVIASQGNSLDLYPNPDRTHHPGRAETYYIAYYVTSVWPSKWGPIKAGQR
ncbi:MAG: hypothetical protein V1800_12615 [Candidatus Latescibacterota bacterium]